MTSQTDWVESLSPWPAEFGLDRMRALLDELGNPQGEYGAIHVVGTKGKSTATRTIDALLRDAGVAVGSYTSPHVMGWNERIQIAGEYVDFEHAVGRVRASAERLGATQFEILTAAALTAFADASVDVAVLEAGLGGRLDATNVVDAPVVLLTNVGLEHTDVLGETHEAIAREKLALAHAARVVVMPDNRFAPLVPHAEVVFGGAHEAAEAYVGRTIDSEPEVALPGRLELRGDDVWDGAHTPEAVDWLLARLPKRDYVLCVSVVRGHHDVDAIFARLARAGSTLVATASSNPRTLSPDEVAEHARSHFAHVETVPEPVEALRRAHELGDRVLVTGSLYLLADLYRQEQRVR